jgi:hypothetical protein
MSSDRNDDAEVRDLLEIRGIEEERDQLRERSQRQQTELAEFLDELLHAFAIGYGSNWVDQGVRVARQTAPVALAQACEQMALMARSTSRLLALPDAAQALRSQAAEIRLIAATIENIARMVEVTEAADAQRSPH